MKAVRGGRPEYAWQLAVPVQVFDLALALMHEEELRWDVLQVLSTLDSALGFGVVLERQVPQRQLVVCTRSSEGLFRERSQNKGPARSVKGRCRDG